MTEDPKPKKMCGFATLSPEKRREIAKLGGRAAQDQGKAHRFTREEAQAAGRKSGAMAAAREGHLMTIGAAGGHARAANRRLVAEEDRRAELMAAEESECADVVPE